MFVKCLKKLLYWHFWLFFDYQTAASDRKWSNNDNLALRHHHAQIQVNPSSFRIIFRRKISSIWQIRSFIGLLWPRYECLMVQMSIFFLVLSGLSEIGKKIPNNNDQFEEKANFCHFRPFLACFRPVMAPVWMMKGPNEYIFLSSV